jgi:hypothetical protein
MASMRAREICELVFNDLEIVCVDHVKDVKDLGIYIVPALDFEGKMYIGLPAIEDFVREIL